MSTNRSSNSFVRNISADDQYNQAIVAAAPPVDTMRLNNNINLGSFPQSQSDNVVSTELSEYTSDNIDTQDSEVESRTLNQKTNATVNNAYRKLINDNANQTLVRNDNDCNGYSTKITADAGFFGANNGSDEKASGDADPKECKNCCDFLCCRKDKRCPWIMRKNCNKGCLEDVCKCRCNRLTPREKKQCGIWTIFIIIVLVIAGWTFIHLDNERVKKQKLSYKMKQGASKVGKAAVSVKNSVVSGANSVRKAAGRVKNKVLGKKKAPWWKFWAPKYE